MKAVFICLIFLSMLTAFAIGLISGLVILHVQDTLDAESYRNLMVIYDI
jgi:hypothetical protein